MSGGHPGGRGRGEQEFPQIVVDAAGAQPARFDTYTPARASAGQILRRVAVWSRLLLRLWWGQRQDQRRGIDSESRRARRLSRLIGRLPDSTRLMLGQLAMRLDAVPLETASVLSRLQDEAAPMPLEEALARIERAAGVPADQLFAAFDPEPTHSGALSCVYQAELADGPWRNNKRGAQVSVRVRQPGIAAALSAERAALGLLLPLLGLLLPPQQLAAARQVKEELPQMLFENLNFHRIARLKHLYRKAARRAGIKRWTAARVYLDICDSAVIVSERIEGVRLSEVLAIRERGDAALEAYLTAQDIDRARCARSVARMGWWGLLENYFFTHLIDDEQIIVEPGGRLVLVDLGDTGLISHREQRVLRGIYTHLVEQDVEGAVALLTQLLTPLPHIDVHEFTKRLESRLWNHLVAMENKHAEPWERTTTGLWIALFETTRQYGVPVNLQVTRLLQSASSHEHLAAEIWPPFRALREYRRYERRAEARSARRVLRERRRQADSGPRPDAVMALREGLSTARRLRFWMESSVWSIPPRFHSLTKKGAYAASQLLWLLNVGLVVTAAATAAAHVAAGAAEPSVLPALRAAVRHPAYLATLGAAVLLVARRIMLRLDTIDPDDD